MEKFKLSENIDPNKVFIINHSELEGRLDSFFYINRPDFHNTIRLSKIAKIKGGKRIPKDANYSDIDTPNLYLRVTDIDESTEFNYLNFKSISDELYEKLKRYEVFENELIISIAGTVGKTKVVKNIPDKKRVILTENCVKILTNSDILPQYLNIVLQTNFLQKQIELSYIQTTIPKLGIDKILGLKIPQIPPLEIQQQIVDLYEKAYAEKQQKEAEAQRLLDSIDDYLLGELGITLPKEELLPQNTDKNSSYNLDNDNPLVKKGRLFLTNLSEVTGKRWNAFEFKNRKLKLGDGNYPNKTLKHLAYLLKGQSITSNGIEKGDYPVIAGGQISPYTYNLYNFKGNVITISASGAYSGYVWYHNYPIFASDCTVVFSKEESEITTLYLSEILKLKQKEIYNLQQGAGQPHVYARDLEKINIPIPSLQKQKDITNEITTIREEAKQLQIEAINTLETAKRNIEQMILGN